MGFQLTATSTFHVLLVDSYGQRSSIFKWQLRQCIIASWAFNWQLRQRIMGFKLTATSTQYFMNFALTATSTFQGGEVDNYVNVSRALSWPLRQHNTSWAFSWQLRQRFRVVKLTATSTYHNVSGWWSWQLRQRITGLKLTATSTQHFMSFQLTATSTFQGCEVDTYINVLRALSWQLRQHNTS